MMGDPQWLPGYCVLLTDDPTAQRLSDLSPTQRSAFLESLAALGEAVERVCGEADRGFRRVNLAILGNADALLHAHVWPRYAWEPPELVHRLVWLYPVERARRGDRPRSETTQAEGVDRWRPGEHVEARARHNGGSSLRQDALP
jgi:diadenosine tetraphosphate (Ap4A) HIT family hydrolase